MRTLLANNHPHAREAVDLFVFRAAREIGALTASLGGLDGLVFTAGIGEHASEIRSRVCTRCTWLGVVLDESANRAGQMQADSVGLLDLSHAYLKRIAAFVPGAHVKEHAKPT